jgi:hypothetical protein
MSILKFISEIKLWSALEIHDFGKECPIVWQAPVWNTQSTYALQSNGAVDLHL